MRNKRLWKALGLGLLGLVTVVAVVRWWILPAALIAQLEAIQGGRVTIQGFWIGNSSSGVAGLTFYETHAADAPVCATIERVDTDLSLGSILRGRFRPTTLTIRKPEAMLRLSRRGEMLTPWKPRPGDGSPLPRITVEAGQIRIQQDGRPEFSIQDIDGTVEAEDGRQVVQLKSRDPQWGLWRVDGQWSPSASTGEIALSGLHAPATPQKVLSIPWIPEEVWQQVVPDGPVDVRFEVVIGSGPSTEPRMTTRVDLRGAALNLPVLHLVVNRCKGTIGFSDGVATFHECVGTALDGVVAAGGSVDFRPAAPRLDLDLQLKDVAVADAPASWQFDEIGLSAGRMSGQAHVRAVFKPEAVDLTGSSGEATIARATIQEIPVKSLKLQMRAEGSELRYDTAGDDSPPDDATQEAPPPKPAKGLGSMFQATSPAKTRLARQVQLMSGLAALRTITPSSRVVLPIGSLVAVQDPPPPKPDNADDGKPIGFRLPRSLSTEIELEDVDLAEIVAKVERFGIRLPIQVSGRLSIKAKAKIPLGKLADLSAYRFEGDGTLLAASIGGVDLGRVQARLLLADGVLELTDFQGRLIDRPAGSASAPPRPTEPIAGVDPLPSGGFRGHFRAQLSPKGPIVADFEGNDLPIGEIAAPLLPTPTPLSGLLDVAGRAEGDVACLSDPEAWTASGHLDGSACKYETFVIDAVAARFDLKAGRFELLDLEAKQQGRPLVGSLAVTLKAPLDFDARIDIQGWQIADALRAVPNFKDQAMLSGEFETRARISGTLQPREIRSEGEGRLAGLRSGPLEIGTLPFSWDTADDRIRALVRDAKVLGGTISAEAEIPTTPDRPMTGSLTFHGLEPGPLMAKFLDLPVQIDGKADGDAEFVLKSREDLQANLVVQAPNMTFQGVATDGLKASGWVRNGVFHYEMGANGLGGRLRIRGDWPLHANAKPDARNPDIRVHGVGFTLADLLAAIGLDRSLAEALRGEGAFEANVRILPPPDGGIATAAIIEARELAWVGDRDPEGGRFRATVRTSPSSWRLDRIEGSLWGGTLSGRTTSGRGANRTELALDRADLTRTLLPWPALSQQIEGLYTIRLSGALDRFDRLDGRLTIPTARIFGIPIESFETPIELAFRPASRAGSLELRRASFRIAGGESTANLVIPFGQTRPTEGDVRFRNVNLETLIQAAGMTRSGSGKMNGRVVWSTLDMATLRDMKGRVTIDLDDASLFQLPILSEIGRLLGAANSGVFDDGGLEGVLNEQQLVIEQLTLEGRLVQLQASGTVGYDQTLDLKVLIATNQIIPQTGLALLGVIPGLNEVISRREQAIARIANFLSNKLVKVHVGGTLANPIVETDASILVTEAAVNFFAGTLRLPLDLAR